MKKSPKLANRYANALFEFSILENQSEKTYQDIVFLKNTFHDNKELRVIIESPIIEPDKKNEIFSKIFKEDISPITFGFLSLVIKKRREPSLILIFDSYIMHYYEQHNIKIATITTAMKLDEGLQQKIKSLLEDQTKSTIDLRIQVNPSILGGFVIKIEDQLLDASLLGKINKLKMEFSKNIYQAGF